MKSSADWCLRQRRGPGGTEGLLGQHGRGHLAPDHPEGPARTRATGGGPRAGATPRGWPKPLPEQDPTLVADLEALVDPDTNAKVLEGTHHPDRSASLI